MRLFRWLVVLSLVVVAAYLAAGSYLAARILEGTLVVGVPTAQGSGWPEPETPADIGYSGDPSAAYSLAFENVELATDLGSMPAWLIPAGQEARRWAIFVHGIGGRRENGYRFLPTLHEAGLDVLMIAYRNDEGAPASREGIYAFGLTEWHDLDAAVAHALDHGAEQIVVVAESMGGGIVGQFLASSPHAARIGALVLDAPAIDLPAALGSLLASRGAPLAGVLARGGIAIFARRRGVDLADAVTTDTLAAFPGPMFLSHGAGDRLVPVATSDTLAERRGAPTRYLRTDADHILSWKSDPAAYDAALAEFLSDLP